MRKNIALFSLAIALSALTMFTACYSSSSKAPATTPKDTTSAKTTQPATDSVSYMLPSPLQIGSIFKNAGLTYMPGLTDSVKETSQFNSKYSEALNMGIYGADLSYCVLNKKTQDALNYLKSLRSLAGQLGFGDVFESNSLAKRFENNLAFQDSLTSIIADLQMNTDTYLAANKQQYITTVAFAGAWVESMYIGSKVYAKKKSANISDRISEQMTILDNLVKALNEDKDADTHINGLINSLRNVENTYMDYPEIKNSNPDSDQMPKLTDLHIAQLSTEIEQLRKNFIMS